MKSYVSGPFLLIHIKYFVSRGKQIEKRRRRGTKLMLSRPLFFSWEKKRTQFTAWEKESNEGRIQSLSWCHCWHEWVTRFLFVSSSLSSLSSLNPRILIRMPTWDSASPALFCLYKSQSKIYISSIRQEVGSSLKIHQKKICRHPNDWRSLFIISFLRFISFFPENSLECGRSSADSA